MNVDSVNYGRFRVVTTAVGRTVVNTLTGDAFDVSEAEWRGVLGDRRKSIEDALAEFEAERTDA